MNREMHEMHEMHESDHFPGAGKMVRDQFPDVTKFIMGFYPSKFDESRIAKGIEFDSFGYNRQNDLADCNYGESATIARTGQL